MKKLDSIIIGNAPNDQQGDPLRTAFERANKNFASIAPAIGDLEAISLPKALPASGSDLDAVTEPGWYNQDSAAGAEGGKNYPVAAAGLLLVRAGGGTRYQLYIGNALQGQGTTLSWRSWQNSGWSAWARAGTAQELEQVRAVALAAIPAAQMAAAGGVATLDANRQVPAAQIPPRHATTLPSQAHDLDDVVTPGPYQQTSDAGAAAGAHYPVARAGFLQVTAGGNAVLQQYTAAGDHAPRPFWRVRTAGVAWSDWHEAADVAWVTSLLGAAGGIATLDAAKSIPAEQIRAPLQAGTLPYLGLLPEGADLNAYVARGLYTVAASATAMPEKHFPVSEAGFLEVAAAAAPGGDAVGAVVQKFHAASSNGVHTRALVAGAWGAWKRLASSDEVTAAAGNAVTHVRLAGNGINLNDCHAGEHYYTWADAATMVNGLNFPPGTASTGTLQVSAASTASIAQSVTLNSEADAKPRMFNRRGNAETGAWGPWKCTGAVSSRVHLPTVDAGDVYVDGIGWFSWDSVEPAGYYLKAGQRTTRVVVAASGPVPVPAYVRRVFVRGIGGGGGGAYSHQGATESSGGAWGTIYICSGGGGGGGAGEYAEDLLTVKPGIPLDVVIGAGGTNGTSTTGGNPGGQTTIQQAGTMLKTLQGGGGGGRASFIFAGSGGWNGGHAGGTGSAWFAGASGYASSPGNGGSGASSPFGAGGRGGTRSGQLNYPGGAGDLPLATAWGAGGGGGGGSIGAGSGTYASGASGINGVVIVEY